MAMNQRLRSMAPYAAQVLNDEEVRDAGKRALGAATKAYGRAKRPAPKRKITDAKLWQRLGEALSAAVELLVAISTPPPPPKRRWPRRLAIVALIGGGVALAANAEARAALLGAVGKGAPSVPETPPAGSTETPGPTP